MGFGKIVIIGILVLLPLRSSGQSCQTVINICSNQWCNPPGNNCGNPLLTPTWYVPVNNVNTQTSHCEKGSVCKWDEGCPQLGIPPAPICFDQKLTIEGTCQGQPFSEYRTRCCGNPT
jgi:hypothetical protein